MIRNLLLTFGFVLSATVMLFAQQGALKGKVLDKKTKEPIPFANIVLENKGTMVGGATSDIDGNYQIQPIPPGKYDLKATFVGYKTVIIQGINIAADQIRFYDIEMTATTETLQEVEIVDYKVPLISKDQTASGASVTSEEVAKMPTRSANGVATTVGGVFSEDGERGSIRGARSDATAMYIDGIRVIGNQAVPQSAIEQVDIILGGTPAKYGDVTSGVINVTTKGASRQFGAGFELETSQFLDKHGFNRFGFNVMGPLIRGKDKNGTALLGFFIAGDLYYKKDGYISAVGHWYAKDSVLSQLEQNPLRPTGLGRGTYINGEFINANDIENYKYSKNTNTYDINILGNMSIRTTDNITLTIGGSYNYSNQNLFSYSGSLLNYDKNPLRKRNTYRGYVRFVQRFPTSSESTSTFKNFYYSLQFDYTKYKGEDGDPDHWDDVFKYGYLGKFTVHKTPTFEYGSDTVDGVYYQDVWILNSWNYDTLVEWSPRDINPLVAQYTTSYYDMYGPYGPKGYYDNFDHIQINGGLLNGDQPQMVYGLYSSPGTNSGYRNGRYSKFDNDQFNISFDASLDIGNHSLQFGFQYEQRVERSYGIYPTDLWYLMRSITNFQIEQLDVDNPYLISHNGIVDTIIYYRKYDQQSQKVFDANLRRRLGLPVDGLDYIVIDSYDYNNNSIQYYDKNGVMHTVTPDEELFSIGLFSPDELWNQGQSPYVYYSGFDYQGNKLKKQPSYQDFFDKQDESGMFTREIGAFQPIYMAGYIQDKFALKDLVFNIGLRVDRYDANQQVLKDPFLLFPAKKVSEVSEIGGKPVDIPGNIGSDYVVYVDNVENPQYITGFRSGSTWYNSEGEEIPDPSTLDVGSGISPLLVDPNQQHVNMSSFKDYEPEISVMPRISFSFPISDEALFFAHYDVLTQRPTSNSFTTPATYYYFDNLAKRTINNPALTTQKSIDYEVGFKQKLSNTSVITFSTYYKEIRGQIDMYRYYGAYPRDYTTFSNIDFATTKGLTVEYDLRRTGNIQLRASYTLQFADGTGGSAATAQALIAAGLPNLRTTYPMPWDRRHQFNIVFDFRFFDGKKYNGPRIKRDKKGKAPVDVLSNFGFNVTVNGGSGVPYTASRNVVSPLTGGTNLLKGTYNGSRLPWQFRVDMRIDKDFYFKQKTRKNGSVRQSYLNIYFLFLNMFNNKNILDVYPYTGNPDDDGYLTAPEWQKQINNQLDPQSFRDLYSVYENFPWNYAKPIQIHFGVGYNF
jgi:outer membrane receptor protein involved in Fe transport